MKSLSPAKPGRFQTLCSRISSALVHLRCHGLPIRLIVGAETVCRRPMTARMLCG